MFGFRLRVPARGDDITADWARELVKAVRSLRLHAGPGIRLTRTPDGTTVSVNAAGGGFAAPAKQAEHFGNAEDAEVAESWSVSDDEPAIIDLGTAKILVDSRGNVIAWNVKAGDGDGGEDGDDSSPDDPTAPSAPPPCGNPLNADDDYNPLDDTEDDDYNPLNYEGEGGYTPTCEPRASA